MTGCPHTADRCSDQGCTSLDIESTFTTADGITQYININISTLNKENNAGILLSFYDYYWENWDMYLSLISEEVFLKDYITPIGYFRSLGVDFS